MIQIRAFCFPSFFISKLSKMIKYCLKAIYLAQGNGVHSPQHLDDMFLVAGQWKAWRIFWV